MRWLCLMLVVLVNTILFSEQTNCSIDRADSGVIGVLGNKIYLDSERVIKNDEGLFFLTDHRTHIPLTSISLDQSGFYTNSYIYSFECKKKHDGIMTDGSTVLCGVEGCPYIYGYWDFKD